MRKHFIAAALATCLGFTGNYAHAQQTTTSKTNESDEIVIRKKGDKDTKVTVEFKDGQVTVNGKQLSEYNNNDDITISRRKTRDVQGAARSFSITTTPGSPFRSGTFGYNGDNNQVYNGYMGNYSPNKAFLGVMTEKDDNGARITSVTKNSAAEKAGLKEGDVITKIDNTSVESQDDLTKAIGKYKPEDKATITYKRDKKEQKTTATLGKRPDVTNNTQQELGRLDRNNFNFDMLTPGQDGRYNFIMRGNNPRLGIKAQDTEDGKGVKVLDVDDASNAEKAGIKEGDIITEFDGKSISSTGDLMDAAKDMKDKNSIKVKLSRDGKTQETDIKIPKKLKTTTL